MAGGEQHLQQQVQRSSSLLGDSQRASSSLESCRQRLSTLILSADSSVDNGINQVQHAKSSAPELERMRSDSLDRMQQRLKRLDSLDPLLLGNEASLEPGHRLRVSLSIFQCTNLPHPHPYPALCSHTSAPSFLPPGAGPQAAIPPVSQHLNGCQA